ncbi:MAG: DUF192 domain-containing protein [Rhodobacteraceae bacterium]|nr:DUF192 domain-containing protein [Paracoccaceae bacterium]
MIRAATFTLGLLAASAASAACTDTAVDLRGDFGSARFNVEVADDPAERAQGLMNRPSMPASAGMLFLYDAPQRATFWMKNTLIPLDMIFLDQTGTVTRVHENAVPLDETTIDGGPGVVAVLEINGGLASAIGISEGSQLRHPGLDQSLVAWPCE